jgi:serine protease Do
MSREWLKFGGLVALTLALGAAVFSTAQNPASPAEAQERTAALEALADPGASPVPAAVQPLADLSESFSAVADKVRPSVVFIRAQSVQQGGQSRMQVPRGFEDFFRSPEQGPRLRRGSGTGFIISKDGYIVTNNHVVEDATSLTVRLFDKREFGAKVVGRDPETDVAVIKIDAENLPALVLGNSDSLRVGEWVLAVGNPLAFTFTVTAGIVSAKGRLLDGLRSSDYSIMDFIQTDAVINPGNSGGPLVNIRGQVVGVNAAIASDNGFYQGYGFAIPINLARVVANQLIADGRVRRAVLGVQIRDAAEDDAAYSGLSEVRGVVVVDYSIENSPARAAGIQPEDLIVEVDGRPVEYVAQLQQAVGFKKPGETVRVTVVRHGGERKTYNVRLMEAPSEAEQVALRHDGDADTGEISEHGGQLGITVSALSSQARAQLGEENTGAHVTDVDLESPAQGRLCPQGPQCGFGDIITHVNGERVRSVQEFDAALRKVAPGDVVSLRIYNPSPPTPGSRLVRMRVPR